MVFEDKLVINKEEQQYVGVSYLIAEAYKNANVTLIFAESNAGLKARLKDLACNMQDDSLVLVFVDLVADNQNTWGLYNRLVDIACTSQHAVICIVPIPCMEYCYLKAFNRMLTDRYDYELILKRGHLTKSKVYGQGYLKKNGSSFENFCKCVRRTYLPYDANITSFHMEDKSFYNSYIGKSGEPLGVAQKGWAVVQMLPVFFVCGNIAFNNTGKRNLVEIIEEMYKEFEEQAAYYNSIGFHVGNILRVKGKYEQHKDYLIKRLSEK